MVLNEKVAGEFQSRFLGRSAGPGVGYLDPLVRRGRRKGRRIFDVGTIKLSEYNKSLLSSAFTTTLLDKERRKYPTSSLLPESSKLVARDWTLVKIILS